MPARLSGIYYGWVLAVMLGITQTITWGIVYYGFSSFLPAQEAELGWSRGEMSGALSVAMLLSGLAAAPVGHWLDHHGPRLLMTLGTVAAVALLVVLSQVTSLVQFYVVWALLGLVMATILYEPAFVVITAWFERQRTRAMMIVTLMAGLASTIFFPVAAWLIERLGWRPALLTLAAFLAVTVIVPYALVLRRRPEDIGQHLDGDSTAHAAQAAARRAPRLSVGQALRQPSFRWLAIAFSLNSLASIAVYTHLIAYMHDRGFEATLAATLAGLVGAMQVVGRIILGALGDRVPLRVNAAVVLGLQPVAFLVLLLVPGFAGLAIFVILFGASRGAVTLVRPAFVADIYGRERYGTIAGALAAFVTVATAAAPLSAGVAYDFFGAYDLLLWTFAALSVLSSALALLVRAETDGSPLVPTESADRSDGAAPSASTSSGGQPVHASLGGTHQGDVRR
jgi:MFS family permease